MEQTIVKNDNVSLIEKIFTEDAKEVISLKRFGTISKGDKFHLSGYNCQIQDIHAKHGKVFAWIEIETGNELKIGIPEVQHQVHEVKLTKDNITQLV